MENEQIGVIDTQWLKAGINLRCNRLVVVIDLVDQKNALPCSAARRCSRRAWPTMVSL